jgi:hypothetical protein
MSYAVRWLGHAYVPTAVLREALAGFDQSENEQWVRSRVIAPMRDAGVLIASSSRGYKIPCTIRDVVDFVERTNAVVHPMLNRIARARNEVLFLTNGRVDVLGFDRLELLRTALDAIKAIGPNHD